MNGTLDRKDRRALEELSSLRKGEGEVGGGERQDAVDVEG